MRKLFISTVALVILFTQVIFVSAQETKIVSKQSSDELMAFIDNHSDRVSLVGPADENSNIPKMSLEEFEAFLESNPVKVVKETRNIQLQEDNVKIPSVGIKTVFPPVYGCSQVEDIDSTVWYNYDYKIKYDKMYDDYKSCWIFSSINKAYGYFVTNINSRVDILEESGTLADGGRRYNLDFHGMFYTKIVVQGQTLEVLKGDADVRISFVP